MFHRARLSTAALLLAGLPGLAVSAEAAPPAATLAAHWETVPFELNYTGFTTWYSCQGIEDKLRLMLKTLGARAGAKVVATGCEAGPNMHVSRFAWVRGEYQVLRPGEAADAKDTVQAGWQPVELRADRPLSVGDGECELVEQLKPVIDKAAALREVEYITHCTPHQVNMGAFHVKALALLPAR